MSRSKVSILRFGVFVFWDDNDPKAMRSMVLIGEVLVRMVTTASDDDLRLGVMIVMGIAVKVNLEACLYAGDDGNDDDDDARDDDDAATGDDDTADGEKHQVDG